MASRIASSLPDPTQLTWDRELEEEKERAYRSQAVVSATKAIPPYGRRSGWIPRHVSDVGDGGAFPEIQICPVSPGYGKEGQG